MESTNICIALQPHLTYLTMQFRISMVFKQLLSEGGGYYARLSSRMYVPPRRHRNSKFSISVENLARSYRISNPWFSLTYTTILVSVKRVQTVALSPETDNVVRTKRS